MIKASSHTQIETLLRDLASDRPVTRDAAVARLTVIGARAVERLVKLAADLPAGPSARSAALRALDSIGDPRALDSALVALNDDDAGVVVTAIGVASTFLRTPRSADVVDRLASIALDQGRAGGARKAAVRALRELPGSSIGPLFKALAGDPDAEVAALAEGRPSTALQSSTRPADVLRSASAEHDLPDDPVALRHALLQEGRTLPLTTLHRFIQRLGEREAGEPASRRPEWMAARAAAHAALATRGSRIALYDLRETLEAATEPLPVDFLSALTDVGDASCLDAIAVAYSKASAKARQDDWWRRHLADAFRAIAARERITRRHAVMKKIEKRWPDAAMALWSQ